MIASATLRRARVLLAVAALALLWACGDSADKDHLALAKAHLAKREFAPAILQLKSYLQTHTDVAEARFLLGQALLKAGDPVSAQTELEKAENDGFPEDRLVPVMAQALLEQAKFKPLIERYGDLHLDNAEADAELTAWVAWAHARQGALPRALELLDAAAARAPGNVTVKLVRVRLLGAQGQIEAALKLADEIVAADPAHVEAWRLKGDLALLAKVDGAEQAYRRVLALDPGSESAYAGLVRLYVGRQDPKAADAVIADMAKALPDHPQTRFFLVLTALHKRDLDAARRQAAELLRAFPQSARVQALAGMIETEAGALAQAQGYLTKALQLEPRNAAVRRLLGAVYLRTAQPARALVVLRDLVGPDSSDAEAMGMAAEAALQAGDAKAAEGLYRRAAQVDPADARFKTAVILAKVSSAGVDPVISELQVVAAKDPGTYVDWAIATLALSRKKLDRALGTLAQIEQKDSRNPLPAVLQAGIELERKDRAAARASLARALARDASFVPALTLQARLDAAEGKAAEATARLSAALKLDPGNFGVTMALVTLKSGQKGAQHEVTNLLKSAALARPSDEGVRVRLVRHLLGAGDLGGALAAAQEAVAAQPDSAVLKELLARTQLQNGQYEQALASFAKLATDQPDNAGLHFATAEVQTALNNIPAAERSLQRALELKSDFLPAQRALAAIALTRQDFKTGLEIARTLQRQRPNEAVGYVVEGDLESARRNWSGAEAAYAAAERRHASTALALKIVAVMNAAGRKAEAARRSQAWEKANPKDLDFVLGLGDQLLAARDAEGAERQYQRVLALNPRHPVALNNLAWVLNLQNKPGALERAEAANALLPGNASILDTLAALQAKAGRHADALATQRKAIDAEPANATLKLNLARLLLGSGDRNGARAELDRLLQGNPDPALREQAQKLLPGST